MALLEFGSDSRLYGTTPSGGATGNGVVFSVNQDGTNFQVLHSFNNTDGAEPLSPPIQSGSAFFGAAGGGGGTGTFTLTVAARVREPEALRAVSV